MRLGRAAFWRLVALNLLVATILLAVLPAGLSLRQPPYQGLPLPPLPLWPLIALLACLPIGWLGAQRLHDVGQRGWHAWLPLLAFACVTFIPVAAQPLLLASALWVQGHEAQYRTSHFGLYVMIAVWLGLLLLAAGVLRTIFLWLAPGDAGDNRFGPPPADARASTPVSQQASKGWFLTGRMGRLRFWLLLVANVVLVRGLIYMMTHLPAASPPDANTLSCVSAFLYLPACAAAVLRLHDRGQSGLLGVLVFVLGNAAPRIETLLSLSQVNLMNAAIDIVIIYVLFQCLQPGYPDSNRFGPPPGGERIPGGDGEAGGQPLCPTVPPQLAMAAPVTAKPVARQGFGRRGL